MADFRRVKKGLSQGGIGIPEHREDMPRKSFT
jgi:hypothetical protein